MAVRILTALLVMFGLMPLVAAYILSINDPAYDFVVNVQNWKLGMIPVAVTWLVFFFPCLIPGIGPKYCAWALKTLGFTDLWESARARFPDLVRKARLKGKFKLRDTRKDQVEGADGKRLLTDLQKRLSSQISKLFQSGDGSGNESLTSKIHQKVPVAEMKQMGASLLETIKPEGLDREMILNTYTLDIFAHIRGTLRVIVDGLQLEDHERQFCIAVVQALPEQSGMADEHFEEPQMTFPRDQEEPLIADANRVSMYLSEDTFESARAGDLASAMQILRAIIALHSRRESAFGAMDPILAGQMR